MSGKFLTFIPSKVQEHMVSGKPARTVGRRGIRTGHSSEWLSSLEQALL